jgi:hypothetical protein
MELENELKLQSSSWAETEHVAQPVQQRSLRTAWSAMHVLRGEAGAADGDSPAAIR